MMLLRSPVVNLFRSAARRNDGLPAMSSIQALDRTQPGLPMKKGRCGTMTRDYKRHGTTSLFAALNLASGEVVGRSFRRRRHQEVPRFLREVEKTVPPEQDVHIVLDNHATRKHEKVAKWVERKKRVHLHFTPTSASWLNLVERFFARLTEQRLRRHYTRRLRRRTPQPPTPTAASACCTMLSCSTYPLSEGTCP